MTISEEMIMMGRDILKLNIGRSHANFDVRDIELGVKYESLSSVTLPSVPLDRFLQQRFNQGKAILIIKSDSGVPMVQISKSTTSDDILVWQDDGSSEILKLGRLRFAHPRMAVSISMPRGNCVRQGPPYTTAVMPDIVSPKMTVFPPLFIGLNDRTMIDITMNIRSVGYFNIRFNVAEYFDAPNKRVEYVLLPQAIYLSSRMSTPTKIRLVMKQIDLINDEFRKCVLWATIVDNESGLSVAPIGQPVQFYHGGYDVFCRLIADSQ